MVKTEQVRLRGPSGNGQKMFCACCHKWARNRVTFEDNYGKLVLLLCNECAEKEYKELLLQGRLDWPT